MIAVRPAYQERRLTSYRRLFDDGLARCTIAACAVSQVIGAHILKQYSEMPCFHITVVHDKEAILNMRVLVVSPEGLPIPPRHGGSVQIYLSNLFRELAKRPDVDVILLSPGQRSERKRISSHATHLTMRASKEQYWRNVHKVIHSYHPDVIQIDNRPAQALEIAKGFPTKRVILNLHSLTFLSRRHISESHAREILNRAVVVCNSADLARTIRSRFRLKSTWHPHVIYPGVTQNQRGIAVARSGPHTPLRVLFVGRVIEQKGVHVLIRAVRALRDSTPVKLTVVGGTHPWERAYRTRLKRMARGLDVKFAGFVQPQKLSSYYESHDILVCPSQKHEAFGLVNLEAMSYGLPVVASNIGGVPEAVGGKGGVLIHSFQSPSQFAAAIRSFASSERYLKYSQAARRHARRFTWSRTARGFAELYRQNS
ncbi:glycosyltransferase family 4 protein [Alicyclobacillus fastidiosus]|uniref:Glycosyltransferase family 4 protein n=1 Tax=Alicyclobacillus fastidiosus TaxID=392011 RepID=A0ABV5AA10_9BACL|nr:glycosyltransferase family 4 protein [Alicyclobacillus fastidiosus]WEH07738.1 glycosyltransferase family 4 protein [Alicyclobacillus fastidiosus]